MILSLVAVLLQAIIFIHSFHYQYGQSLSFMQEERRLQSIIYGENLPEPFQVGKILRMK